MNILLSLARQKIQRISRKAEIAKIPFAAVAVYVQKFLEPARSWKQASKLVDWVRLNKNLAESGVLIEQEKFLG